MSQYDNARRELFGPENGEGEHADVSVVAQRICDLLHEGEVVEELSVCTWKGKARRGAAEVHAIGYSNVDGVLTLMLVRTDTSPMKREDLLRVLQPMRVFVEGVVNNDGVLMGSLPPESVVAEAVPLLRSGAAEGESPVKTVRLMLVSAGELNDRSRKKERSTDKVGPFVIEREVWDIARLAELLETGHEALRIDLTEGGRRGLSCLSAHLPDTTYECYLCVVPGKVLASLYGQYGSKLLETNVRGFLSETGKVNRGLRKTLVTEKSMFFAYNNGLTATARKVDTREEAGATTIVAIEDLQIVNGGQTTASLYWATRKKPVVDLEGVFVQMKLVVVPESAAMEFDKIVSDISRYANSQNAVAAADLFSNHPFHQRMEKLSRHVSVPVTPGAPGLSYWYYERARAQYRNELRPLSGNALKAFQARFPKERLLTKTDFAKYYMAWHERPHVVSDGAQKCFTAFADEVSKEWDRKPDQFHEVYYKRLIGAAILFRAVEAEVGRQPWHKGFRINIVAYTVARAIYAGSSRGFHLDAMSIWRTQSVSPAVLADLIAVAKVINERLPAAPERETRGQWGNLGQWFKSKECWDAAKAIRVPIGEALRKAFISSGKYRAQEGTGEVSSTVETAEAAFAELQKLPAGYWAQLKDWNQAEAVITDEDKLKAMERELLRPSERALTEPEALFLYNIKEHAEAEGFTFG